VIESCGMKCRRSTENKANKMKTQTKLKSKLQQNKEMRMFFLNENEHKANKRKLIRREKLKLIGYSPATAPKTC